MPRLKRDLPDHLYWLTEKVERLVKPAGFLVPVEDKKAISPLGGTRPCGRADVPQLAPWAPLALGGHWDQSPYDGESLWLQLNLEEIPGEVRAQLPQLPPVGMVWLTLDLKDSWKAHTYFDARSAKDISWHPRPVTREQPRAMRFVLHDTLTCATDATLPEISNDYHGGIGMCCDYDEWWQEHYGRDPADVQVGGWIHPIQGDIDEDRQTVVLAIEHQPFGDSGAVYLHYSVERGFWAEAHTH